MTKNIKPVKKSFNFSDKTFQNIPKHNRDNKFKSMIVKKNLPDK